MPSSKSSSSPSKSSSSLSKSSSSLSKSSSSPRKTTKKFIRPQPRVRDAWELRALLESHCRLSREEFLKSVPEPCLLSYVSLDPSAVASSLVVPIRKKAAAEKPVGEGPAGERDAAAAFADRISVGRAPENDIVIDSQRVSKHHAYFLSQEDAWTVTDLGSSNGTHVDGRLIPPDKHVPLRRSLMSIEFADDAKFVFFTPLELYDFLDRVRGTAQAPGTEEKPAGPEASAPSGADLVESRLVRSPSGAHATRAKPAGTTSSDEARFDQALRALGGLGELLQRVEIVLRVNEQVVPLKIAGSGIPREEWIQELRKFLPVCKKLQAFLAVGKEQAIELYESGVDVPK